MILRYRVANTKPEKRKFLRKSQLWSQEFTAKLFCNVEFWIERMHDAVASTAYAVAAEKGLEVSTHSS